MIAVGMPAMRPRGLEHGLLAEEAAVRQVVRLHAVLVDQCGLLRSRVAGGGRGRRAAGRDQGLLPRGPGLRRNQRAPPRS